MKLGENAKPEPHDTAAETHRKCPTPSSKRQKSSWSKLNRSSTQRFMPGTPAFRSCGVHRWHLRRRKKVSLVPTSCYGTPSTQWTTRIVRRQKQSRKARQGLNPGTPMIAHDVPLKFVKPLLIFFARQRGAGALAALTLQPIGALAYCSSAIRKTYIF